MGTSGLSGCYLFHEREAPAAVERSDAGGGRPDAGRPDGGARVDAGSSVPPRCTLSLVREQLVASEPGAPVTAPDLFWTGERIGVLVFASHPVAHPVVSLTHVDPGLDDVAALRRVGEEAHGWGEAAWTGDAVGVCWNGDPGGVGMLRFREVPGLDGPLGPRTDFEPGDGPCLDLVFAHGRYAMTWRVQHSEGDDVIVRTAFQLFERDGSPVGERHLLAEAPYPGRNGVVVAHPDGFVYVVATDDLVRVVRVDSRGRVAQETALPAPGAVFAHADLRDGRLGVLSLRGPVDTRALVFTLLDEALRPVAERVLEDGAPTASNARVLARPEGWVLVWGQGSRPTFRTMVLSLDPDGVPLAPRRLLFDGDSSSYGATSSVSVGDSVYVGISHPDASDPTGRESVYVQRWVCDEPADDPCRPDDVGSAGDCDVGRLWGWRWTGSGCEPVVGCPGDCLGPDCPRLAATRFACESDRRECMPRTCPAAAAVADTACGPVEAASNASSTLTLAARVESCPCVPTPTCRAGVSGPRELTLELVSCEDGPPECDCAPGPARRAEIQCLLPPMQAGTWTLSVPGGVPFELTVRPPWEPPSDESLCRGL